MLKRFAAVSALSLVVFASCEPAAPLVPFEIVLVTPAPTTQTIATVVMAPPTFEVRTESGKSIKNVDVTVTANASSGSVVNPPLKTTKEPTPIGTWSLGTTPGAQSVTVSVEGLTPLVISLTAIPGAPSALALLAGNGQLAAASTAVSAPITVQITDAFLNPISGVTVNWVVTAGGGNVAAPTSLSNSNGVATAPTWTLGAGGTQTLEASVGTATQNIGAVVATPPAEITLSLAPPSISLLGSTLDPSPTFVVRDSGGNALPNIPVSVIVSAGGGSLQSAPTESAAGGVPTSIGSWTLGNSLGAQTVTVSVVGVAPLVITTTAASLYELEVVFPDGPPSAEVQTAFNNAVTRIKGIIVGQLTEVHFPTQTSIGGCGFSTTPIIPAGDTVPGLRIYAGTPAIDGPGSVLGSAGPRLLRQSNSLTVIGCMRFDIADIPGMIGNGSLESVILHEMLHVVGIGTLWDDRGVMIGSAPTSTPQFTGPLARQACVNDHGGVNSCAVFVPIEDCKTLLGVTRGGCGAGTINSHWHELVFGNELMTGFASAGLNPFSRMTILSLQDMGYTVNTLGADPYTILVPLMSPTSAPLRELPAPMKPYAKVDANGRITEWLPEH